MSMEATPGNLGSDMDSAVFCLSSRSKDQGVISCGEMRFEAKASVRSLRVRDVVVTRDQSRDLDPKP
jgi:hypothetical protein